MPSAAALRPSASATAEPVRTWAPWDIMVCALLWSWAIWSCAEHWRANPNYSYGWAVPVLALGFAFRRYLIRQDNSGTIGRVAAQPPMTLALGLAAASLVGFLEYSRLQVWRPQIVLTAICLFAIAGTCLTLYSRGGWPSARYYLFPILFFLTALPWPPRFEQPLTSQLMIAVAGATVEILHLCGVEASRSGGAIALSTGLVGVTEACSGIRSLQAGLMFGLAMGEWFLLNALKRIVLVLVAIFLALATNLGRTVALCLQAEWHGPAAVEKIHDLVGTVAMTSLIGGIWIAGRLLHARGGESPAFSFRGKLAHLTRVWRRPSGLALSGWVVVVALFGFVAARAVYISQSAADRTQTEPFFALRNEAGRNQLVTVPKEIWKELNPTSGTYVQRRDSSLPRGIGHGYHFFWKPSPWNRFVLVHRPDICMPGIGWQLAADPVPVTVGFGNKAVRFHAFRFRRDNVHALALWGAWRNGDPVTINYKPEDVLGANGAPPPVELQGKRRSATEIVACSLVSEGEPPAVDSAVGLLRSVFDYAPHD